MAVAAGGGHSLALRADGTVVARDASTSGQTNVPTDATNVLAIAAGAGHSQAFRVGDNLGLQHEVLPDNVRGPYLDVPGATHPYTNGPAAGSPRFFRLRF